MQQHALVRPRRCVVDELEALGIRILERTVVSGGRRVRFFSGPDDVQLEFIVKKN